MMLSTFNIYFSGLIGQLGDSRSQDAMQSEPQQARSSLPHSRPRPGQDAASLGKLLQRLEVRSLSLIKLSSIISIILLFKRNKTIILLFHNMIYICVCYLYDNVYDMAYWVNRRSLSLISFSGLRVQRDSRPAAAACPWAQETLAASRARA